MIRTALETALLAFVLVLAASCAAAPPPAPKWSDRVPAIAAVYVVGDEHTCSGVAVGDHTVLTAAHCVHGTALAVYAFPGEAHRVVNAVEYPDQDTAVLTVDGPALKVQARIAQTLPESGDLVFVAGFGCYDSLAVAPGLYVEQTEFPGPNLLLAVAVCLGDSGGPAFNERGEVFGVVSSKNVAVPLATAADVRGL